MSEAYDVIEGKYLDKVPKPLDYEFDNAIVRFVPELQLVEVALAVPEDLWVEMAKLSTMYENVERPPERIIFRSHRGIKVNVFLDNGGDV